MPALPVILLFSLALDLVDDHLFDRPPAVTAAEPQPYTRLPADSAPCEPLPVADAMWRGATYDAPRPPRVPPSRTFRACLPTWRPRPPGG